MTANKYITAGSWAVALTALDQFTKWLVVEHMPLWTGKQILPGFFNLVHVRNRGTAWGILDRPDIDWQIPFLSGIAVAAILFIGWLLRGTNDKDRWMITGLGFIAGGAAGNLIDRIRLGEVVDFLDFYVGNWHWPAFNVADIALTLGAGCILVSLWLHRNHHERTTG